MSAGDVVQLLVFVGSLVSAAFWLGSKLTKIDTKLEGVVEKQHDHEHRLGKLETRHA